MAHTRAAEHRYVPTALTVHREQCDLLARRTEADELGHARPTGDLRCEVANVLVDSGGGTTVVMCTVLPLASVTTTCAASATVTPSTNASGQRLSVREGESVGEDGVMGVPTRERFAVERARRCHVVWEVFGDDDPIAVLAWNFFIACLKPPGMAVPVTALHDHGRLSRSPDQAVAQTQKTTPTVTAREIDRLALTLVTASNRTAATVQFRSGFRRHRRARGEAIAQPGAAFVDPA